MADERGAVTVDDAIQFLNELVRADHDALLALYNYKVPCNDTLRDHPAVQVSAETPDGPCFVGLLGLLNGLFGTDEITQYGHITMEADTDEDNPRLVTKIIKFRRTDHLAICGLPSIAAEIAPEPEEADQFHFSRQ